MIQGIHVHSRGWKNRGYKGRVEVWDKDGKVVSAHKTVREAIDSIPPRKVRSWYRKFIDFLSKDFIYITWFSSPIRKKRGRITYEQLLAIIRKVCGKEDKET